MAIIRSGVYLAVAIFGLYATAVVLTADMPQVENNFRITTAFLIVFAISWLIGITRAGTYLEEGIYRLARRGGMVFSDDDRAEILRVNVIRIAIGFLFFVRAAWIGDDVLRVQLLANWTSPEVIANLLMLLSAACVMFGVLTPVFCLICTAFLYFHIDGMLRSQTLGTYVLMMSFVTFTFLPVGTALSADAWLARRSATWQRILQIVYGGFGRPSARRSGIVRFLSFTSYALVCLYSSLFHIDDPAWIEGFANLQALSSSFLGRQYAFFQHFYDAAPALAIWLSKLSGVGMIIWEMFLIPLVLLSRWTRLAAITWGLLFFCASLFLFQLSFLPYYEFVFWALLFLPMTRRNAEGRDQIEVFFDDRCNLCDRTIRFLMAVDLFNVILPRPASKNIARLAEVGLSYDDAMSDLYGWDGSDKRLHGGLDFYLFASRRIFLLKPVYVILLIGDLLRIGRPVYRWVAERRRRIFGVCEFSTIAEKSETETSILIPANYRGALFKGAAISHLVFALAFIAFLPHGPLRGVELPRKMAKNASRVVSAALNYGIGEINVFNRNDLLMSTNFFVIDRVLGDGTRQMVPYQGLDGGRLGMDRGDAMLYGVSIPWRRRMIDMDTICYDPGAAWQAVAMKHLIAYDQAISGQHAVQYVLTYYHTTPWDYDQLRQLQHQTFEKTKVCEVTISADTASVVSKTVTAAQLPSVGQ